MDASHHYRRDDKGTTLKCAICDEEPLAPIHDVEVTPVARYEMGKLQAQVDYYVGEFKNLEAKISELRMQIAVQTRRVDSQTDAAVLAEREACAKIAEDARFILGHDAGAGPTTEYIVRQIRVRSNK